MKKRILFMTALFFIVMLSIPLMASAAAVTAGNFAQLKSYMNSNIGTQADPLIIEITGNIEVTESIGVWEQNVCKTLVTNGNYIISRGSYTGYMFAVNGTTTVNIGGVPGYTGRLTFDGAHPDPETYTDAMFIIQKNSNLNVYSGIFQNCRTNSQQGVFRVENGNVVLYNDVLVTHNYSNGWGGAAFITGWDVNGEASITVNGATISDNYADDNGGAISVSQGKVIVNGGLFQRNVAKNGGNVLIITGNSDRRGKLIMNGGLIDGTGTVSPGNSYIQLDEEAVGELNAGTVQNTDKTAIVAGAWHYANVTVGAADGTSAFNFINCGQYDEEINTYSSGWGGAIRISGNDGSAASLTINAASFTNCNAESGGAIYASNPNCFVVVKDALFENCKANNGGAIYAFNPACKVTVEGGRFENCNANVGGAILFSGALGEISGGEFINCTGNYGAGFSVDGGSIVDITGGTFEGCTSSCIETSGDTTVVNLTGGSFVNCRNNAIQHKAGTLNMGGSAKFDAGSLINLMGNKINIISGFTIDRPAVANIANAAVGTVVLTGEGDLVADNHARFGVAGPVTCGVNALGAVDGSTSVPSFTEEDPGNAITLALNGNTAVVTANYDAGSAVLIIASYDADTLIDFQVFDDIDIISDQPVERPLKEGFNKGGQMKIMLWESLDAIKPLVDVKAIE